MNQPFSEPCRHIWWKSEENAESDCGVLCAGYFSHLPEHSITRDGIDQWVVLYCVEGKGWYACGKNAAIQEVSPGTLLCIPANAPHAYGACPENPWGIYWFHCRGILEPELMEKLPVRSLIGISAQLTGWFQLLLAEMDLPASAVRTAKCRALAQLVLINSLEFRPAKSQMEEAKQYLEQHYLEELSIEKLAARFGLSEYHFIREFTRHTGMPPNRYRVVFRIRHACTLLEQRETSVAQVSEQLGYQSPYYFSRQFKQLTGYSPKEYRAYLKGV